MNIHESVKILKGAVVSGKVSIGKDSSVWYNAVIRADSDKVVIGERTNIQDNSTVHSDEDFPCCIGNNVTVGHNAIVHGCTVEDNCIIGMGAIILNGAKIGRYSIIGAGALVTEGMEIPEGSIAFGNPAKVRRTVSDDDRFLIDASAEEYLKLMNNPDNII